MSTNLVLSNGRSVLFASDRVEGLRLDQLTYLLQMQRVLRRLSFAASEELEASDALLEEWLYRYLFVPTSSDSWDAQYHTVGTILEFACDLAASTIRKERDAAKERLRAVLRALRRVNGLVSAILREFVHLGVNFFCCARWERRRWFLRHGARPPKHSVQAINGLFSEACPAL